MNLYSDKPPLYYTCTTCHRHFSQTVGGECPYCELGKLKERMKGIQEVRDMYKDCDALLSDKEIAKLNFHGGTLYHLWQAIKKACEQP